MKTKSLLLPLALLTVVTCAPDSKVANEFFAQARAQTDKSREESNTPSVSAPSKPATPTRLYGRIEQLVDHKGAALPRQLRKLTPILDTGQSGTSDQPMSGQEVKSFPIEWAGIWKGNVTVTKRENLEVCWLSQPAATYRSCQFFKPGATLSLICRFNREGGSLTLSPPVARAELKHAEDLVQAILAENVDVSHPGGKVRLSASDLAKTVPAPHIESFSFGKRYGPSLGGNFIDSDILSNQLRELSPGIIEQDVVTQGTTQSMYGAPEPVSSMGESVVRLTRKNNQLLVNLAYVNYQHDGMCVSKCILEGYLEKVGD